MGYRYRKVSTRIWDDRVFRKLSDDGKLLFLYLITGRETMNIPGVVLAGEATLAEALGWASERLRKGLRETSGRGLTLLDQGCRIVWLPRAIHHNPPESPNVVKGWSKSWSNLPDSELLPDIFRTLKDFCFQFSDSFREAFEESFGSLSKDYANQEQEQSPDQEQKKDMSSSAHPPTPEPSTSPSSSDPGNGSRRTRPASSTSIDHVIAHYQTKHPRSRPGGKERKLISARLKEGYSSGDLCQAIDGCHASPHHQGKNESGTKYQSLELIVRNSSKVSQFLEIHEDPPNPDGNNRRKPPLLGPEDSPI